MNGDVNKGARTMSEAKQGGISGVLDSPYGHIKMMFDGKVWPNGTPVKDNRIEAETLEHRVPDHWIIREGQK